MSEMTYFYQSDPMTEPPGVRRDGNEHIRMADEAARDVWRSVMALLEQDGGKQHYGVQHVDGRIVVTVEVR